MHGAQHDDRRVGFGGANRLTRGALFPPDTVLLHVSDNRSDREVARKRAPLLIDEANRVDIDELIEYL